MPFPLRRTWRRREVRERSRGTLVFTRANSVRSSRSSRIMTAPPGLLSTEPRDAAGASAAALDHERRGGEPARTAVDGRGHPGWLCGPARGAQQVGPRPRDTAWASTAADDLPGVHCAPHHRHGACWAGPRRRHPRPAARRARSGTAGWTPSERGHVGDCPRSPGSSTAAAYDRAPTAAVPWSLWRSCRQLRVDVGEFAQPCSAVRTLRQVGPDPCGEARP